MRTKKVQELPKCDFCEDKAQYDARHWSGSWANFCEPCYKKHGSGDTEIGTKFVQRDPVSKKPDKPGKPQVGIELTSIEELIEDEDRMIGCPSCGEEKWVEPDAHYVYTCEGCGIKVKVPMSEFF